jgi:hypothetical protein
MSTVKNPTVNVTSSIKLRLEQQGINEDMKIHRFADFVIEFGDVPLSAVSSTLTESVTKLIGDLTVSSNPVTGVNLAPIDAFSLMRIENQGITGTTYTIDKTVTPNVVSVNISGILIRVDYIQGFCDRAVSYLHSQLGLQEE